MRYIYGLILCFILNSCSLLSPVPQASHTYLLTDPTALTGTDNNPSMLFTSKTNAQKTLVISSITSLPWLNTTRMAYQQQPDEISYFAQNNWAATPAELLQPIITHALQQSGIYRAVVTGPTVTRYDQRLDISLLAMQQAFWQKPSVYQITLQIELINNLQQVIAATQLNTTITAPSDDPQGGVTAANQAVAKLMPSIVQFCKNH